MYHRMTIQHALIGECPIADFARVRFLAGVNTLMPVQVALQGECSRTDIAYEKFIRTGLQICMHPFMAAELSRQEVRSRTNIAFVLFISGMYYDMSS